METAGREIAGGIWSRGLEMVAGGTCGALPIATCLLMEQCKDRAHNLKHEAHKASELRFSRWQ